jgi:hypothetical protein
MIASHSLGTIPEIPGLMAWAVCMSLVSLDRQAPPASTRGLTSLADVVSVTEWKQFHAVIGARYNTSFLWKWLLFVGERLLKYVSYLPVISETISTIGPSDRT